MKRRKDDYESSEGDYEESASEEEQDTRRSPRKSVEKKGKKSAPSVDYAGPSDLKAICVTRAQLAALCPAPWFASWVESEYLGF